MTYSVTVKTGVRDFVAPNGIRYQAGDSLTLSDREYGLLAPGAVTSSLQPGPGGNGVTGYLGGTVSHQVTILANLTNVVLPNGIRYDGGAVVVLSDEEYSLLTPPAKAALFSADTTTLT